MSPQRLLATTLRVLRQLRHDPRTIALLVAVPGVLLVLLDVVYRERPGSFQAVGIPLFAIIPFITMFLVTSVTVLRERRSGTLERLLASPLAKADLLVGYQLAFALVAVIQVTVLAVLALGPLGLEFAGSVSVVLVVGVLDALLGSALGLLASSVATTEFQAVQLMPAVVFPQLLLGGLLAPIEELPDALEPLARALPLTSALSAVRSVASQATVGVDLVIDLLVVAASVVVAVAVGAATLRRRSA